MKKIALAVLSAMLLASMQAQAAPDAPPAIDEDNSSEAAAAHSAKNLPPMKFKEEPLTKEEIAAAKKTVEQARVRTTQTGKWAKTRIDETIDNHGRVTEVKVTPMATQIPYTMTRETGISPQSQDSAAGKGSTMSIPKFINFGF
jgi:hypothetical protein